MIYSRFGRQVAAFQLFVVAGFVVFVALTVDPNLTSDTCYVTLFHPFCVIWIVISTGSCTILMTVLFISLLVELRKLSKNSAGVRKPAPSSKSNQEAKETSDQVKITQALTTAITAFLMFYVAPTIGFQLVIRLDGIGIEAVEVLTVLAEMTLHVNGILNFFIYTYRMKDVRRAVLALMPVCVVGGDRDKEVKTTSTAIASPGAK